MPFTLGQRWISDTESELGLGTVVAMDARTVTLLFPSTGENRLYARSDSPVTRVMFNPGDTITSHEGWQLHIDEVKEENGLLAYVGTRLDTEETNVTLREVLLDSKLVFSKPQDRLFAGQIDRMDRFALRYRARKFQSEQYRMPYSGLRGQRTNLIPHQLNIAHDVGRRHAPRVLLADEVGLGKTIEAGMILHQQLLSGAAERVLIIVPETLQHQWLVEMLRRFNLRFALFDDERYTEAQHDAYNPFETEQLVICSLDFARRNKQRLEHLCDAEWDLLVVDEAHHLVWSIDAPSREYMAIEQLAERVPGVLLLTATPEQLGMESHFARLRLLDPNRFHDFEQFVEEQKNYRPVADAVAMLLAGNKLSNNELNRLGDLIGEQDIEPLLQAANSDRDDAQAARQELVSMLMDRHGTSRVLFRNTRNGVKGFPKRELHTVKLPLPTQYQTAIKVSGIMGARKSAEDRGDNLIVLTPSDHMLVPDFPGLPEDGCTITFERDVALSREDAQFITWEHPLIRNGLDLILSGDTGSSTISLLKNKALPVGTLLVELIYVVEAQAPKQLQLNRFLPPTPVRMLLDKNGNNLAAQVEFETFNRQLSAVNRHTGSKLVNAVQQDVHAILQLGETQIEKSARALIDNARREADEKLSGELSRLEALRAVNPNIRDDELAAIDSNRQQVLESLNQAGWRLDALRLIVVTHQ